MTTNDEQMIDSLDHYFKSTDQKEDDLIEETKQMEERVTLFNYPSFQSIFDLIAHNKECTQALLSNLKDIIIRKQIDDAKRIELIENSSKWNNEKGALQNEINKLRKNYDSLKVKYDKQTHDQITQTKKMKEMESVIKAEKEQSNISITKLNNKEIQYANEIKKKEALITRLSEQITKYSDSISKKEIIPKNHEIYISYSLNEKKSNVNGGINSNKNSKEIFNDEMSRALSEKYQLIIKQNEYMKSALSELNKILIDLTLNQKNNFLIAYKETFCFDFAEGDLELSIDNGFDINNETEKYIEQLKYLFIKLKEFVIRKDELAHNGGGFNINSSNDGADGNGSMSYSKKANIDQSYVMNIIKLNEYYKELADDMSGRIKELMRKGKDENSIQLSKSEIENIRAIALNNTISAIDDNNRLDGQLYKDKASNQNKRIVNYNQLKNELINYIEILNTTDDYTYTMNQNQTDNKHQSIQSSDDNVIMN